MSSIDKNIYDAINSESLDHPEHIKSLAYAVFASEKYEWYSKFQDKNNRNPTQEEVEFWIEQITPLRLDKYCEEAIILFEKTIQSCLPEVIQAAGADAVRKSFLSELETAHKNIVSEVRSASAFWKQMCLALATAILAPLMLGALAAAILGWSKVSAYLDRPARPPVHETVPSSP